MTLGFAATFAAPTAETDRATWRRRRGRLPTSPAASGKSLGAPNTQQSSQAEGRGGSVVTPRPRLTAAGARRVVDTRPLAPNRTSSPWCGQADLASTAGLSVRARQPPSKAPRVCVADAHAARAARACVDSRIPLRSEQSSAYPHSRQQGVAAAIGPQPKRASASGGVTAPQPACRLSRGWRNG